jgi:ribulose 1,5-bisphosphate synthetase/thiazole synthase
MKNVTLLILIIFLIFNLNSKRIIIVGSGMAGLSSANFLKNTTHDVLILEARNRVIYFFNFKIGWR